MLRLFRELKISLAAKCQLLFGIAVVLIIAATLLAPWRRMEQLMEELDERSARLLTEQALLEHALGIKHPAMLKAAPQAGATTTPARLEGNDYYVPRLIGATSPELTNSEKRAIIRFNRTPDQASRAFYYTRPDNTQGYRYTRPLYLRSADCLACHTPGVAATEVRPASMAATTRATAGVPPPVEGVFGLITVDIASQKETNQVLLNRMFFLAAGLLAGSLALVVFSLITSRFILQPVRVLQETADKVSRGDLDVRSNIPSGDEFQQLSETFNLMLHNLGRSEAQLREANTALGARLSQLSETNVALAETNRLKTEFLANVSHELRTPLNSILGFADLLRKSAEAAKDAKSLRYASNIYSSGNNLLALINDLLDLAKVEAGRMEVRPGEFPIGQLFETLVSVLKPLTEPRNITISPEVDVDVPILTQDVSKVQQILYNFLSNAIKFSPTGGQILLRAISDELEGEDGSRTPAVRIAVTDQGPGIEEDKQRLIFEKFRQLDAGHTRQHGGTGLGLAISKELTAILGGTIGIESTPGEGASFFVVIPVKIEAKAATVRRA